MRSNGLPQKSFSIAGRVITDVDSLVILRCETTGATNVRATFGADGAPATGYQVPVGKRLRVIAIKHMSNTPGSTHQSMAYQSDNDVGQSGVSTAFTNGSARTAWMLYATTVEMGKTSDPAVFATNFTIAAGKYCSIQCDANAIRTNHIAYGVLENV